MAVFLWPFIIPSRIVSAFLKAPIVRNDQRIAELEAMAEQWRATARDRTNTNELRGAAAELADMYVEQAEELKR